MLHKLKQRFATARAETVQKRASSAWTNSTEYNYQQMFPDRYANQIKFANEMLIPHLKPGSRIIDLGCGDGWFTQHIAPYCARVDGYDLAMPFIEIARREAAERGNHHLHFHCADVLELTTDHIYTDVLCMGLFTTVIDDAKMRQLLIWLYDHMEAGGYLGAKDSLNIKETVEYKTDTYHAMYRSLDHYVAIYKSCGFELIDKMQLSAKIDENGFLSHAFLFRKPA